MRKWNPLTGRPAGGHVNEGPRPPKPAPPPASRRTDLHKIDPTDEDLRIKRAQETLAQFIDPAEINYARALRAMLEFEKDERTHHNA